MILVTTTFLFHSLIRC